jgi:hypothetical protein
VVAVVAGTTRSPSRTSTWTVVQTPSGDVRVTLVVYRSRGVGFDGSSNSPVVSIVSTQAIVLAADSLDARSALLQ